jgi:ABC-2 type transport system ATP-binding protein
MNGEDVTDLEVRRASLEDTYLTLVLEYEGGRESKTAALFEEVRP